MATMRELIHQAQKQLRDSGCDAPRLDAELLLMQLLKIERTRLIIDANSEVDSSIEKRFNALVEQRSQRIPLAHLTGEREFWSRSFTVNGDVLIPRPETEHLIEAVIEHFPDRSGAYRFCDIGTGSGCIAITLACEYANATIIATDISAAALAVAKANGEAHGVSNQITWLQGDMLQPLTGQLPFDAILSNPPYVSLDEMQMLEPELAFEPRTALTDEADGLKLLNILAEESGNHLKSGGLLIVETGPCGLPADTQSMHLSQKIDDLAGHLRGGLYIRA